MYSIINDCVPTGNYEGGHKPEKGVETHVLADTKDHNEISMTEPAFLQSRHTMELM